MPHVNKQMASFFLTTKCNLRCKYCYNSKERNNYNEQTLSLEIARAGVDYYFKNYSSRYIRFYGPGEPTQAFELLKYIVNYASEKSEKPVLTELQTNGCFSKSVREWLLDHLNIIWVSFDGEPNIHNKNRPCANGRPSSPIIEENVRWLINNKKEQELMVGARVTITEANIHRQKQLIDYFFDLGIRYIWNDPLFPSVDAIPVCEDTEKLDSYHFDMDVYVEQYIEAHNYAKNKGVFYGSFLTCNFDGISNKHCRACTPMPHFTTDGYISACDLVTFGENPGHMECFVYGKWNDKTKTFDIDNNKLELIQSRTVENMPHCKNCNAKEHCGGYCLGEVKNETGDLFGQKKQVCKAIRKLAKEIGFTDTPFPFLHP